MNKIKLLIIGSDEVWSMEKHYRKYLSTVPGLELSFCPLQSVFYRKYNKSIVSKLLFKAGLSSIPGELDTLVRQQVEESSPDIVWVFKGMELRPSILQWMRTKKIKLVNYNPDNPFLFSGTGSGNSNITHSIGLYDLHLTYDRSVQQRIEKDYGLPCKILPFAFELENSLYIECTRQHETERLCFLGNPDKRRAAFIEKMANSIPVDVYGNNWSRFVVHSNIDCYQPVYGDEFWKVLYRYRIQLNLMRPHNPISCNMRSFEVPGVGGIGLFPDTPDHRLYFEPQKDVFLYRDEEDCIAAAHSILEMSCDDAAKVRQLARKHSLEKGYTYEARSRKVLSYLKELLG